MNASRRLIDRFADVHPLPHVVTTLNRMIADPESTMQEFEEVIRLDPILVSRLLRLVNSPYFGLLHSVDSISRAVAFLGMKNLHNLVVTDALKAIFVNAGKSDESSRFSKKRLWLHSAAVSICCRMVAERIFSSNGDDAFICGILHDFGLLVEEQTEGDAFAAVCADCTNTSELIAREEEAFATDHCRIAAMMTGDWHMSVAIQEAIRDHHTLGEQLQPESLSGILQIAEYIAAELDHGTLPGLRTEIAPPLLAHIEENLDEYRVLIEDVPEEMARAEAIYGQGG